MTAPTYETFSYRTIGTWGNSSSFPTSETSALETILTQCSFHPGLVFSPNPALTLRNHPKQRCITTKTFCKRNQPWELSGWQRGKHKLSAEGPAVQDKAVIPSTWRCAVHRASGRKLVRISLPVHYKLGNENCSSGSQHLWQMTLPPDFNPSGGSLVTMFPFCSPVPQCFPSALINSQETN